MPVLKSLEYTGAQDTIALISCDEKVNDWWGGRYHPMGVHRSAYVSSRCGSHPSTAFLSGTDAPKGHFWLAVQVSQAEAIIIIALPPHNTGEGA